MTSNSTTISCLYITLLLKYSLSFVKPDIEYIYIVFSDLFPPIAFRSTNLFNAVVRVQSLMRKSCGGILYDINGSLFKSENTEAIVRQKPFVACFQSSC